ncbi:MAG: PAS domain S-box protein [Anaerolineae bacterium]|nr:PAS domain S-box protein [Anaerolineae bacterium]
MLHQRELEFQTLFENAPDIISRLDRQLRYLYVNPAIAAATGISPERFIGKTNQEVGITGEVATIWERALEEVFETGCEKTVEHTYPSPSGWRYYQSRIAPEIDHDGRVQTVLSVTREITERKVMERALQDSEERYTALFNRSLEAVYIHDFDYQFIDANEATLNLVGYSREEFTSLDFTSVLAPESLPLALETVEELRHTGIQKEVREFTLLTKDGRRIFVETMASVIYREGRAWAVQGIARDVTERKAREAQLRLLWHAINQSANSVVVTDSSGNIEYVNPYFAKLTGYTLEEARGENPRILQSGFTSPEMYKQMWGAITSGHNWSGEFHNRKKNGDLYWEHAIVSPVTGVDGNISNFVAIKEDITERKRIEIQLHEAERFARSTVDALSAHIAILGDDGTILAVNNAWRVFGPANGGLAADLCEGVNYIDILEAVAPSSEDAATAKAVQKGIYQVMNREIEAFSLEYPCHSPDVQRWFVVRVTRFAGDGPTRIVVAHENITERVLAEQKLLAYNAQLESAVEERTAQLERLNERMSAILNNVSNPIVLVDSQGLIDVTNPAFNRRLGYQSDELFGQPIWEIFDEKQREKLVTVFSSADSKTSPPPLQTQIMAKNQSIFDAEIAVTRVPDNSGHMVCTIYDITHLKEIERMKDEFVSMVSHELRTPVSSILLSSSTISRYYDRLTEEQKRQKLEEISNQAKRLAELVTAILDAARFDAGQEKRSREPVDVAQALRDVAAEFTDQIQGKQLHLDLQMFNSAFTTLGKQVDLVRIWQNLLSNAVKYTARGGRVRAAIYGAYVPGTLPCDLPDLSGFADAVPTDLTSGRYIISLLEDSGYGIPEENLPQLFTRFFRGWAASSSITGTGLGLSLVRDLLRIYGGDIAVSSELGVGTTICFWLPVDSPEGI